MQSVSSRVWTRVAVSISYDDNHYTTGTSKTVTDSVLLYKLATIVEGDPKAPFSIATTPRCRGGRYSIPRIAPLYPWTVPYNAEC